MKKRRNRGEIKGPVLKSAALLRDAAPKRFWDAGAIPTVPEDISIAFKPPALLRGSAGPGNLSFFFLSLGNRPLDRCSFFFPFFSSRVRGGERDAFPFLFFSFLSSSVLSFCAGGRQKTLA